MNRAQKETFVENLSQGISTAQAFAFASFSKVDVEQMTAFRLSLRKKNVFVRVVKNTLAKRVLDRTNFKEASHSLEGPTLIVFGPGDPVTTAKALWEWAEKDNFNIQIKGGVALGKIVSKDQLKALSKLLGKNELLQGFLWALKSHPTKFLYALKDIPQKMGYALGALREKKSQAA